jgi:hypothetical protein
VVHHLYRDLLAEVTTTVAAPMPPGVATALRIASAA